MRTISGLLKPKRGEIHFEGKRISGLKGHEVTQRGIAQSPEGRRIFPRMTVTENLELGAFLRNDKTEILRRHGARVRSVPTPQGTARRRNRERCPAASSRCSRWVGPSWPRPRLLLLDEPSMGLAPVLVDVVFDTIKKVNEQGTTVLLVEQNALRPSTSPITATYSKPASSPRRSRERLGAQRRGAQGLPRRGLTRPLSGSSQPSGTPVRRPSWLRQVT